MVRVTYNGNTQIERIVNYLSINGTITQDDAKEDLGIQRLASRICDMKSMGYVINDEYISVLNRYGEKCRVKQYWIVRSPHERLHTD